MNDLPRVTVHTDGSAIGNPGPGGYGVVMSSGDHRKELSGGYRLTTNNRMEILACIVALEALKQPCRVTLHSDSRYVVNAMAKGRAKVWCEKNEYFVNVDLWKRLLKCCEIHEVDFLWVRGHSGDPGNERADQLAVSSAHAKDVSRDVVYEDLNGGYAQANAPSFTLEQTIEETRDFTIARVFVGGSAKPNPGPGGYGLVILTEGIRTELSKGYRYTTNNRMDILGTLEALKRLESTFPILIFSSNRYLVDSIERGWTLRWQSRGWVSSNNKPTPNKDLWKPLVDLISQQEIAIRWLPETANVTDHNHAHRLAVSAARGASLFPDHAYEAESRQGPLGARR